MVPSLLACSYQLYEGYSIHLEWCLHGFFVCAELYLATSKKMLWFTSISGIMSNNNLLMYFTAQQIPSLEAWVKGTRQSSGSTRITFQSPSNGNADVWMQPDTGGHLSLNHILSLNTLLTWWNSTNSTETGARASFPLHTHKRHTSKSNWSPRHGQGCSVC